MGYYEVNGVRRDIREIDALAVLNKVGEQDPQLVVNFTNTYWIVKHQSFALV